MTSAITKTEIADSYQITNIGIQFYIGGGPGEACQLDIRGRKGSGEGAEFQVFTGDQGKLETTLDAQDTLDLLNTPVANLPQDATLFNALLGMLHTTLQARGCV